jgi:hypothetical protein
MAAVVAVLVACQAAPAPDPARSVEAYLRAKVERNAEAVRRLLCSELESQYDIEVTTFEGVSNARIEGMACARSGATDVVQCTGKIVADYGAEDNEFPLTAYRVTLEDGEWKWCGEDAPQ